MKTIAISIDEPCLRALDELAASEGSRSKVVRDALHDYLGRRARGAREALEARIFSEHAASLRLELEALVEEQAEP